MPFDDDILQRHGITASEYGRIRELLGREPNLTELGIFSVMWSEHCSYKSSRRHLKKLPTAGPRVVQGPGENAGAVAIGHGLAAVFKIESHNHPSFIEPYQGAATGVGGIIRDIFTMGARPIALMNSLRFGSLDDPATRRILSGVVGGIAGYGNSIGIPTVGGEVMFDPCYAGNPLVNVLCLGVAKENELVKAAASGVGNPVFYVGAKTGRDGIHGATMASAEFDERALEQRPAVQVGDPFMEKLLLEACLEAMRTGALVGVQDMGAAGLTCSTCEMGSRAGTGIEIDVALVPQREAGMTPYEIMLSESQERMLLVVARGREREVQEIFEKWDLHAVQIGRVTDDGLLRVRHRGETVAAIPNRALTDLAPMYDRPAEPPDYLASVHRLDADLGHLPAPGEALRALLASPTIASKRWIYRQYDHMVRTNTLVLPGMGTAVVRVKGTPAALALSVDGNGRYCYLDPYRGARLAVAEAARNVACAGAVPVGATNCLNFGNPERPAVMWQLVRAIEGMADACRALGIPVTGGNVSLYNETDGRSIYPTPVVGMVGLLEAAEQVLARPFRRADRWIVALGALAGELGGSEYLAVLHGRVQGVPADVDLEAERALQQLLAEAARTGLVESAHDCADGGLAVALAECCFDSGGIGADVTVPLTVWGSSELSAAATLFGEAPSRVIVSVKDDRSLTALLDAAARAAVPARAIGRTGGGRLRITVGEAGGECLVDAPLEELEQVWSSALERRLLSRAA